MSLNITRSSWIAQSQMRYWFCRWRSRVARENFQVLSSNLFLPKFSIAICLAKKMLRTLFSNTLFSPTPYLLLAILQLLQYSCKADAGTIDIAPVTQKVRINDYARFHCKATGVSAHWIVNGNTVRSHNRTDENGYILEQSSEQMTGRIITYTLHLSIRATDGNNNTIVKCFVFEDSSTISDPAILIVKGKPSVPIPTLNMVNSSLLLLEWTTPFTWPDTNITGYQVSVNNKSIGWTSISVLINSLEIWLPQGGMQSTCTVYEFSVVASNELGTGDPGIVTGGFPIAAWKPLLDNTISWNLTFSQNLSPILLLVIQLPMVCMYQSVEYLVELKETSSDLVIVRGPHTLLYGSQHNFSVVFDGGQLQTGQTFTVLTSFTLLGLEKQYSSLQATKDVGISLHKSAGDVQPSLPIKYIALGSVLGVAGLLSLAAFVLLVFFYQQKKNKRVFCSAGHKSPVPKLMVTNPTYEGPPVYETIGHFGLALPIPPIPPANTTKMTSAPPLGSPYDMEPTPYGTSSQVMPSQAVLDEECYTVMSPVKCKAKIIALQGFSSDNETSEIPRYVPDPSIQYTGEC